ncbi:hypothetical protein C8J57DRAFT_1076565 [Mycena rebaudengoi]|nr:hypothetical protein C8J57DRAFT_1076565 [Mycena rebaudengoi]
MALAPPLPLVLLLISLVAAVPTNVTIDDADLAYFTWSASTSSTSAPWAAIAPGAPCNFCSAQPPTTDIQNQTWHDGTNLSSGSFVFQGSDVYIYGIDLANPANISFALDGKPREAHHYAGPDRFVFRALFFAAHDLVPGVNHTVEWAVHATKTNGSTALFDYVVFTADVPATSSCVPSHTNSSVMPTHP